MDTLCVRNRASLSAFERICICGGQNFKPGREVQMALVAKNLPASAGDISDVGLVPESGRFPGGGHDNPLQYSRLENPIQRSLVGYSP